MMTMRTILGVFLGLVLGLASAAAGAAVPAVLGFAQEPMAPIGEPDVPLDRWTAEDPEWMSRPKTLEQAVWFAVNRLEKRIVQVDNLGEIVATWQWRIPVSAMQGGFADSIRNCRLRYSGSGDRWLPIWIDDQERHFDAGDVLLRAPLWAYLDETGRKLIWDFELKCDTANGTETLRRRAILDVSSESWQRQLASQDRIIMIPDNAFYPYRKGETVRFVWNDLNWNRPEYKRYENHPTDPMALDRHLPCKLVVDYFPYAIVSPVLYAYNDPEKLAEALREDPTAKPSDFIEPGKDLVIDITEPTGEVAIQLKRSAKLKLACKDSEPAEEWWFDFHQFQFGSVWVYDPADPSEPPFGGDEEEAIAQFAEIVDMERYMAERTPVAKNCAAHHMAGRTTDGTYWIEDNSGFLHEKFCAMSVPAYEGFMWMGSFVPDLETGGYRWEGDDAAACVTPDASDDRYCAPAVIDALRSRYTYQGGEVGLYAPDTGRVFLYDVNRKPDAAVQAELRSFLESHMDGGHAVMLWMR